MHEGLVSMREGRTETVAGKLWGFSQPWKEKLKRARTLLKSLETKAGCGSFEQNPWQSKRGRKEHYYGINKRVFRELDSSRVWGSPWVVLGVGVYRARGLTQGHECKVWALDLEAYAYPPTTTTPKTCPLASLCKLCPSVSLWPRFRASETP